MMEESEMIYVFYLRLNTIVSSMTRLGEWVSYERIMRKILRSLPPERFSLKVKSIESEIDIGCWNVVDHDRMLEPV